MTAVFKYQLPPLKVRGVAYPVEYLSHIDTDYIPVSSADGRSGNVLRGGDAMCNSITVMGAVAAGYSNRAELGSDRFQ